MRDGLAASRLLSMGAREKDDIGGLPCSEPETEGGKEKGKKKKEKEQKEVTLNSFNSRFAVADLGLQGVFFAKQGLTVKKPSKKKKKRRGKEKGRNVISLIRMRGRARRRKDLTRSRAAQRREEKKKKKKIRRDLAFVRYCEGIPFVLRRRIERKGERGGKRKRGKRRDNKAFSLL